VNSGPRFLSSDDILILHAIAIEDQGGDPTLRDQALFDSAISMPSQQFEGKYLHEDIPAMAAAYAFHICMNHPFIDGNKRAGMAAMIAFLYDNGWSFDVTADEAEPVIFQLAAGTLDKNVFTDWARKHMHEKPKMELREFFSQINPTLFNERFLSLLPAKTQVNASEFKRRVDEVGASMPFLLDLAHQQKNAEQSGNTQDWDRITFLAIGMMTLYAYAEDMGYEW
jgi:death-on-curing protein